MLLAYQKKDQKLAIIKSYKRILTLGKALDANLNIPENSIEKIAATLDKMKEKALPYRPYFAIVATHAVRMARNKKEIIDAVFKRTKLPIKIIPGKEEARLIGQAIAFHFNLQKRSFIGLDIGGGSTEIAIYRNNSPAYLRSLKLGSVTLTEKFLRPENKVITEEHIKNLSNFVRKELSDVIKELKPLQVDEYIISSGVGKTLASMHYYARTQKKLKNPDKYRISLKTINYFYKRLLQLKQGKKIQAKWKLNSNQAEIIIAGLIVFLIISEELKIPYWKISNYGIREGLVLDLAKKKLKNKRSQRAQ